MFCLQVFLGGETYICVLVESVCMKEPSEKQFVQQQTSWFKSNKISQWILLYIDFCNTV